MKTIIGFTGDVAFSEYTKNICDRPEKIDKRIYDFFESNDFNVINFESPITMSEITEKDALAHKSNPTALQFVKKHIKNPILSLANNHMMDFGKKGLLDSLEYTEKENLKTIGAGRNENEATDYVILGDEVKVGILAFQYKDYFIATENALGTAHEKHKKLIKKQIKKLKEKVDYVVLVYHGGDEFLNTPMPYTRKKIKKFLTYGADIIVAHHPHTVQGYEKIKNKTIFYSLGNFIFDTDFQRAQSGTDEGILLKIEFSKDNYSFKEYPIYNNRKSNIIELAPKNDNFRDIKKVYRKLWKKEANRLEQIKANKKELRNYRNKFSINNLHIEKANCKNFVTFDQLIKDNYFDGVNEKPIFKTTNIFQRKFRRIKKKIKRVSLKKYLTIKYAKIFK